jgi:hypothetical protein
MTPQRRWRRSLAFGGLVAIATVVVLNSGAGHSRGVGASTPLGGSAGTDISLPATASAVTASGVGKYANLKVTVNQTQDLVNQVVSVTWTGGETTQTDSDAFSIANNYVQMMECWGDDGTGTGPPPEQCEFGAEAGGAQGTALSPTFVPKVSAYPIGSYTYAFTRVLASDGYTCATTAPPTCASFAQLKQLSQSDPSKATFDQAADYVVDPFIPVQGANVPETVNEQCCVLSPPWTSTFDQNPYFNHNTTNEVDFARTYADGTGQQLFTVDTGLEAPGLGCGEAQTNADGSAAPPPKCWLVVVPRGLASDENPPEVGSFDVITSPLSATAWANRIAIPLTFRPIGTACAQGGATRRIVGGEFATGAVGSWQPVLCGQPGAPSYLYASLGDSGARTQLLSGTGAGMAVVTNPVDPASVDPTNPVIYAPLTLSGLVIAFNIERVPVFAPSIPADQYPLIGTHLTKVNLTPRLVAKLLTESYLGAFGPFGGPASDTAGWAAHNAGDIVADPDFLQYNPEFSELLTFWQIDASQLVVEQPSSDGTAALWAWILADPAAKAWLGGQPDPWGMKVNPYYSTDASANPSQTSFDSPALDNFPKSDPYCYVPTNGNYVVGFPPQQARPLCFQDWSPYANNMNAVASSLAAANSGAKTQLSPGAANGNSAWSADGPQRDTTHMMLGITTTDQALRYGLQVASLSHDGDDGAHPTFVAPDNSGLSAGEGAMAPGAVPSVLVPNPTTTSSAAYPLTLLSYGAVAPLGLDDAGRTDDAAFIKYAVGAGQVQGLAAGSLPPGYVPLPSALVQQALATAATVENPAPLEPTTTTTTAAPPVSSVPTTAVATPSAASVAPTPVSAPTSSGTPVASQSAAPSQPSPTGTGVSATGPPAAPVAPVISLAPSVGAAGAPAASVRTPKSAAGPARYALLIALLVGVGAAVGSQFVLFRR